MPVEHIPFNPRRLAEGRGLQEFRCPNCDEKLGIDVQDWWALRKIKRAQCPFCGWRDEENLRHSKYVRKLD